MIDPANATSTRVSLASLLMQNSRLPRVSLASLFMRNSRLPRESSIVGVLWVFVRVLGAHIPISQVVVADFHRVMLQRVFMIMVSLTITLESVPRKK